jgi:hypothetical protein
VADRRIAGRRGRRGIARNDWQRSEKCIILWAREELDLAEKSREEGERRVDENCRKILERFQKESMCNMSLNIT